VKRHDRHEKDGSVMLRYPTQQVRKLRSASLLQQNQVVRIENVHLLVILRPIGVSQFLSQADDLVELGIIGKRAVKTADRGNPTAWYWAPEPKPPVPFCKNPPIPKP
jgi:hypothetical protein